MNSHALSISLVITVLVFSVVPYLNTLTAELVHDDRFAIVENPDISNNLNLRNIFTNDFWGTPIRSPKSHKSYRPFTVLTFKLNHYLHLFSPFGYHLFNVLLHAINSIIILFLCRYYIFDCISLSLCSACLFATHPIHTEAVAGTVGRAELLACCLFLIALILFNHICTDTRMYYQMFVLLVIGVLAAVSTLCKENGITVLGVCGLLDMGVFSRLNVIAAVRYSFKFKFSQSWNVCKHFIIRSTFLFIFLVMIVSFRVIIQGSELPGFIDEDNPASFSFPLPRLLTYNYLYYVNVLLLMCPSRLSYDWQMGSIPLVHHLNDERNICTLIFWVILISLIIKYFCLRSRIDNHKPLVYSLVLLLVPFIPSSNLFLRVGFVLAERVLYIPSIGVCICVPFGISLIISRFKLSQKFLRSIYILALLFSIKTYQRNKVWLDRESLFRSGIKDMPHNAKMHYNYANYLKDAERNSEAITHYKQAVTLWPSHASSHNNVGTLLEGEEAIQHFKSAVKYKPTHSKAFYNLGNRLAAVEMYSDAIDAFKSSLRIDNTSSDCWQSLATALVSINSPIEEVLYSLEQAELTSTRSLQHMVNIAAIYHDIGNFNRAKYYYNKCIEERKNDIEGSEICYLRLAGVYRLEGELIKCEQLFKRTIELFPQFEQAYTSFGSYLFNTGKSVQALQMYRQAFQLNAEQPDNMISNFVQILLKNELISEARLLIQKSMMGNTSINLIILSVQIETADKQDQKVLSILDQYSSLVERSDELLHFKAIALRNLKIYDQSLQSYNKMLNSAPDNPQIIHDIAILYHLMKEYRKSSRFYQRALDILPNDPLILQNLQRLKRSMKTK